MKKKGQLATLDYIQSQIKHELFRLQQRQLALIEEIALKMEDNIQAIELGKQAIMEKKNDRAH